MLEITVVITVIKATHKRVKGRKNGFTLRATGFKSNRLWIIFHLYVTHKYTHIPTSELTFSLLLVSQWSSPLQPVWLWCLEWSYLHGRCFPQQHFHPSCGQPQICLRTIGYKNGLLTGFSQRQRNEHGCCSWSWHCRPDCCCPLYLDLNQCSHSIHEELIVIWENTQPYAEGAEM